MKSREDILRRRNEAMLSIVGIEDRYKNENMQEPIPAGALHQIKILEHTVDLLDWVIE